MYFLGERVLMVELEWSVRLFTPTTNPLFHALGKKKKRPVASKPLYTPTYTNLPLHHPKTPLHTQNEFIPLPHLALPARDPFQRNYTTCWCCAETLGSLCESCFSRRAAPGMLQAENTTRKTISFFSLWHTARHAGVNYLCESMQTFGFESVTVFLPKEAKITAAVTTVSWCTKGTMDRWMKEGWAEWVAWKTDGLMDGWFKWQEKWQMLLNKWIDWQIDGEANRSVEM